jgi:hypothetical protein
VLEIVVPDENEFRIAIVPEPLRAMSRLPKLFC